MMNNYFPINLNVKKQKCLVVGGGKVAERKALSLLECEADVTVVSPELTIALSQLLDQNKLKCLKRRFEMNDLQDVFLVICATNDELLNDQLANHCLEHRILVNVVDQPSKCNFFVPAVARQGALCISVSTGGVSPMLARKIKEDIEKNYGTEYSQFLDLMKEIRYEIINKYKDPEVKKKLFECLVYSDILELIKTGNDEQIRERIKQCLSLT